MNKIIQEVKLTDSQIAALALQTCHWWNATIFQGKRYLDSLSYEYKGTPWNEDGAGSIQVAERMFLIVAVYNAIENLQKLDIEIRRNNDTALADILTEIYTVASPDDIKNLRDMNIHALDYLVNKGRRQEHFISSVTEMGYTVSLPANWTVVHGNAKVILLGNVQIDKLLLLMKSQLPTIRAKTEEIFEYRSYGVPTGSVVIEKTEKENKGKAQTETN